MKGLSFLVFWAILMGTAFASQPQQGAYTIRLQASDNNYSWSVTNAATVYTKSFETKSGDYFALSYQAVSYNSAPNLKIYLQQSDRLPVTEGSADTFWVVPDNMAEIATGVITEVVHHKSFSPLPLPYSRIMITDASNTVTDAVVWMNVSITGEVR
jgi:hypothetical protein